VSAVIGWDVGGANVKAARVEEGAGGRRVRTWSRPFEIWKDRAALPGVLRAMAAEAGPAAATAVTMTAELSDAFRTKREGVGFVLDALAPAATGVMAVFTTAGGFVDAAAGRARPLDVAASNWMATAMLAAGAVDTGLLVDIGSTTTDVVPIRGGRVTARGRTDPERLVAGELVYTGAVRTNVAAIVPSVPLWGSDCPVAAEYFAISGDVHLLRGDLDAADYTCPAPDGRAATPEFAAERLARVVCADGEMLPRPAIDAIAAAVAAAQVAQIGAAIARVASSVGSAPRVVATGQGAFLAHRAAARCGLPSCDLSGLLGVEVGSAAPAVAVAWLLLDRGW
jgi:(4-(4-[2-(gamma-L-glutamylamino)ethyl]phenoxymethyl)furan-2-yl)methanamine synthase